MTFRRALLYLIILAVGCRLLLMATLPLVDPTEGRYAVVSQEMALGGDWVTPKVWIDGELIPFLGKPPLFFWMAAASMHVFGVNEFAARLPSWLAMVALVALMGYILRRYTDERTSWLAMGLTVVCPVFLGLGGAVATDMLLALFVSGSILVYLAFAREDEPRLRHRWSLLLFAILAGGFMTKGPVSLALFGLPVLGWTILHRKWGLLRHHAWGPGIALFLALVVPWFWLCEVRNPGFLKYFFVNENLLRFVTHDYGDRYGNGHLFPRGSALVMLLIAALPWSFLGPWTWWRARRDSSYRRDELTSLLFLGFLLPTLFWCLARQLLLTYLLPMVPLLCAWLAASLPRNALLYRRSARFVGAALAVLLVGGTLCVPIVSQTRSTKGAVVHGQKRVGSTLVFSRRVPYSAYFYGRGTVLPHPKWGTDEAARQTLLIGESAVLVVTEDQLADLSADMAGSLSTVGTVGRYHLLTTRGLPASASEPTAWIGSPGVKW
jgi:4-amino-4-deoxy-L-arabinose transferase-like glycosyltransferase